MTNPVILKNHFQLGYAVRDVDKAIESLGEKFGITNWQVVRMPEEGDTKAVAWAYVNELMLELVDVKPGRMPMYEGWIPDSDSGVKLHHMAYLVESDEEWQALPGSFAKFGMEMVIDSPMGNILDYRYFDTVAELGHYCEFIKFNPKHRDFWSKVPRN